MKLVAILALLLLPMRLAEARSSASPDAVIAALDLGHCSGADLDKQHGRTHVHCSIVIAGAVGTAEVVPPFPSLLSLVRPARMTSSDGTERRAPTPPPRRG